MKIHRQAQKKQPATLPQTVPEPAAEPALEGQEAMGNQEALGLVQRKETAGEEPPAEPDAAFQEATSGGAGAVPYQQEMEQSFGEDFSGVESHVGQASPMEDLGARAAARGEQVAFADASPDKEDVAHELTHVVQQRRGDQAVQGLSGLSSPGDASEREASEVAPRAAAGEQVDVQAAPTGAIGRTGDEDESESGSTPSTGTDSSEGSDACSDEGLGDLFDAISGQYSQILGEQIAAVQHLGEDAAEQDPPPAWVSVAIAVGTVALAAATAGVGAAVVGAIGGTAAGIAAKATEDIIKTAISNGISTAVTEGVESAAAAPDDDMRKTFFRGQEASIRRSQNDAEDAFNLQGRARLRQEDDPCAAAQELFDGLNGQESTAYAIQRRESLASWCNFQARCELGTTNEGEDNAGVDLSGQLGDTSAKGVLGLEVEGAANARAAVTIVDAEIEGLNEDLRSELAGQPIGQLGIAITVHGLVAPPAWYDTSGHHQGRLRFGENEAGSRWRRNDQSGDRWLAAKGGPGPSISAPGSSPPEPDMDESVWNGIDIVLDQEIKPHSLDGLGVSFTGMG